MATKDDPRLSIYRARTKSGTVRLGRNATRSDASRVAPKTHWEARWIGVVPHYPRTAEAFERRRFFRREQFARLRAEGKLGRKGVPDGWGGRRAELLEARQKAAVAADQLIIEMTEKGQLPEEAANMALRAAARMAFDESQPTKVRLEAIAIVTAWCKPKPAQRVEVAITEAEKWLIKIVEGTCVTSSDGETTIDVHKASNIIK